MKQKNKQAAEQLLRDWVALQERLRAITTSAAVLPLLRLAVRRRVRAQVVARLHARFNKLRAAEELAQLQRGKMPAYLR